MRHINVIKGLIVAAVVSSSVVSTPEQVNAQNADNPVLLIIDKDSIEYGVAPYQVPPDALNDLIASVGVRDPLPFFAANVGRSFILRTGVDGSDSWFGLNTVPSSWTSEGGVDDGLQNFLLAGPGLGSPDVNGDRESLLDAVADVTAVRTANVNLLMGRSVCGVIYDADLSLPGDDSGISFKGPNLGIVAFRVSSLVDVGSQWPNVMLEILDARQTCLEPLVVFPQPEA